MIFGVEIFFLPIMTFCAFFKHKSKTLGWGAFNSTSLQWFLYYWGCFFSYSNQQSGYNLQCTCMVPNIHHYLINMCASMNGRKVRTPMTMLYNYAMIPMIILLEIQRCYDWWASIQNIAISITSLISQTVLCFIPLKQKNYAKKILHDLLHVGMYL